jgi:hypothetical protein
MLQTFPFDFINSLWRDGGEGEVEAVCFCILFCLIIFMVFAGIVWIYDNTFNRVVVWMPAKLNVMKTIHNDSYNSHYLISGANNTLVPMSEFHPQTWTYQGSFKNHVGKIEIDELDSEEKFTEKELDILYGYHKINRKLEIKWPDE